MRVLVTGHDGYIGTILTPMLGAEGHDVVGLDSRLFQGCTFGEHVPEVPFLRLDVRDVTVGHLRGFDAVVHLAALSNDPLGDLRPECTYAINHRAAVRLAGRARAAGVPRFVQSSSCGLYGAGGDAMLDENAEPNPVTPYGTSKILAERDISRLADDDFSPTFLRNATVYGVSPRLRGDLVVNNLTGYAFTTGEVLLKSDGSAWRPLVHVEDVARAFVSALEAPREAIHDRAFNVGRTGENYTIREVAEIVEATVPGSRLRIADGAGPDKRCYRVDCDLLARALPGYRPRWTLEEGVRELVEAYAHVDLRYEEFTSSRYLRIKRVRELMEEDLVDEDLRWRVPSLRSGAAGVAW